MESANVSRVREEIDSLLDLIDYGTLVKLKYILLGCVRK